MRLRFLTIVSLLIVIALPLTAKKPIFPLQILNARSVAIMYLSSSGPSGDVNTPSLTMQDRDVLNAVTVAFRNWSRYSVTIDPRQADIIIAVRTAQQNVNTGVGIGIDNHGGTSKHATYGADIGPTVDMIQIYDANTDSPDRGLTGAVLWTGAEKHGLALPDLPLMKRLHQEVDEAEKNRK